MDKATAVCQKWMFASAGWHFLAARIGEPLVGYWNWIALAICVGLTWPNPGLGDSLFSRVEKKLSTFARNRTASLFAIGSAVILVRVMLLEWLPVPQPWIHDEYSYLLAADTYVHGRLSNPPHPFSIFFDTFHVIQHPTYSSIYPPMQGAVLAFGKLLGHPWIGVLLSTAAMCVAITWMLQGWIPSRWALLGGALVFLRFGIYTYWINSYWGGSVPAMGAALLMGAYPRILKTWRLRDVIPFGLGITILATSRPVEGFIYCVPVAVGLLWGYFKHRDSTDWKKAIRVFLALALSCACAVGLVMYCNRQVTENSLVFPTALEVRQYIISPVFIWEHEKAPEAYPNPEFDSFYAKSLPSEYSRGWAGFKKITGIKAIAFWNFFLGPIFSIPFLTLPWLIFDRRMRLVLAQFGLSAAGLLAVVWFHPHYAAPLLSNVVLLGMQGMRHLRTWKIQRHPVGISLTRLIVLFSLFIVPVNLLFLLDPAFAEYWTIPGESSPPRYVLLLVVTALLLLLWGFKRRNAGHAAIGTSRSTSLVEFGLLILAVCQICVLVRNKRPSDITSQLSARYTIGQRFNKIHAEHLIIVRYSQKHNVSEEFVYNEADIDHSKTVWAREIPGLDMQPLLTYFRNRDVWVLEPDENPVRLYPYEAEPRALNASSAQ